MKPDASIRNIGVFMDTRNTSQSKLNALCKNRPFHLRNMGIIRRFLPGYVLQSIGTALGLSCPTILPRFFKEFTGSP